MPAQLHHPRPAWDSIGISHEGTHYEAGPTGYGLYRYLSGGGLVCEVIAPGLVWRQPGDRIKTDPRDARRLAAQYAGGMLRAIHVLSPEQDALRDLVRARGRPS
jgi:transposase